jgi:hypothetical protein
VVRRISESSYRTTREFGLCTHRCLSVTPSGKLKCAGLPWMFATSRGVKKRNRGVDDEGSPPVDDEGSPPVDDEGSLSTPSPRSSSSVSTLHQHAPSSKNNANRKQALPPLTLAEHQAVPQQASQQLGDAHLFSHATCCGLRASSEPVPLRYWW